MPIFKSFLSTYRPHPFPRFLFFMGFLIFAPPQLIEAQTVSGAGSTSTNFQKIGMGARAAGMGNAFTGVADDVTAIFWNPAGLILAKGTQFNFTQGIWLQGVSDEYFAFSQNIDQDGAFGGSLEYLGTGSFPGALENPDGSYGGVGPDISASNYYATLAYAQRLGNWIPGDFFKRSLLGLEASAVGQNVASVGNTASSFNLGYLYEITRKTFYVGALLSNVGTSIQNFTQPLSYRFAGSYQLRNTLMKKDRDIIALDANAYNDTGFKFDLGDEYQMTFGRNDVALRLGYNTEDDLSGITTGVGLAHRFDDFTASLDYAFVPYGVLGDTHRVSLNIIIGGDLIKPQANATAGPAFVLGQQTVGVNFATKSDEPIDSYKITILDSSGTLVKTFSGQGGPPSHYLWDGRNQTGELVPQGNYSFNLEVTDDNDLTGTALPAQTYAKWVPKKVPYQYTFGVSGDLLFNSAKDDLQPRGYDAIQKAAMAIRRRYPDSLIIIAGHTDNQKLGKGAKFMDNQQLSLARAQAVMNYLVRSGMDASKLSVVGYGDTKPIADNDTPEGRSKNRRVELVVSGVMDATATDLIAEGMIQFNQQNYREALDRFLKALESDSRDAKAYHLAGDCYLRLGGKDQAIAAYRKSLKYNPGDRALKQWMDQYAPQPAPMPTAPATNAAPITDSSQANPDQSGQNNPAAPAQPQAAPAVSQDQSAQPQSAAPAAAPATQTAPTGMPQPVDGN
jgi:outer membrane protein OmpA-like peptidoglycan-associated protein